MGNESGYKHRWVSRQDFETFTEPPPPPDLEKERQALADRLAAQAEQRAQAEALAEEILGKHGFDARGQNEGDLERAREAAQRLGAPVSDGDMELALGEDLAGAQAALDDAGFDQE